MTTLGARLRMIRLAALVLVAATESVSAHGQDVCSTGTGVYKEFVAYSLPQLLVVPAGCSFMQVKMWGGGGHTLCPPGYCSSNPSTGIAASGNGGGGGALVATLKVLPTETFTVIVSPQGAGASSPSWGGEMTTLARYGSASNLLVAAGGGGGGANRIFLPCWPAGGALGHGGAGGGLTGQPGADATFFETPAYPCQAGDQTVERLLGGGLGGTQTAGGAGGLGISNQSTPNGNGSPGAPGIGGATAQHAGLGGDGHRGGGGGGYRFHFDSFNGTKYLTGAGGGGGSSYVAPDPVVIDSKMHPGTDHIPGNAADSDRQAAGEGGVFTVVSGTPEDWGKPGRVVVRFSASLIPELTHGYRSVQMFDATGGSSPEHRYQIWQGPLSSYEVVVDGTSGDIGNPPSTPLRLERVSFDGSVAQSAIDAGMGPSRSLRWVNSTNTAIDTQTIRVASTTCTTNCGPDDVYRIRAYDTTYAISRFNNTGNQRTTVEIVNRGGSSVTAGLHFWNASGTLLHTHAQALAAGASLKLNTWTIPLLFGQSGSITVTGNGAYGTLAGEANTIDTATGETFSTPMEARGR